MSWYIISAFVFLAAVAILIYTRVRDRRFERKKASEAMNPAVKDELDSELEAARERREKFREALKNAGGK